MDKKTGLHLYINISNFNDILEREEENYPTEPKHAIHALDTFFHLLKIFANIVQITLQLKKSQVLDYIFI